MKSPVAKALEIVDEDQKVYNFDSRQCYSIKRLLAAKSVAQLFIGLDAEQRGFWYEDEGFIEKK